ncbi:auxin-responsive protein SAUR63 [Ricinus communis]|uniref:auxin-responsive protein SAUR63 n=1 Tax=Ricinus communis TaxID=3988 RepID=UPI00201A7B8C|nr:auxin-responsive protein SAUR63 [Ricinus communis]
MISAKKLIKLARKWQKMAALRRKRITMPRNSVAVDAESCSTSNTVEKGHFVVYSIDERRFVLPLEYLNNDIVKELFMLAEDEFGLLSNRPIIFPCDAGFLEYVTNLLERRMSEDLEQALLMSMASIRCSSSVNPHQAVTSQQLQIYSF